MTWFIIFKLIIFLLFSLIAWQLMKRQNKKPNQIIWFVFVIIISIFWLTPIPQGQTFHLGFAPHLVGICLAFWLFGFSYGILAMLLVVLLCSLLPWFINNPLIAKPNIAEISDWLFFLILIPLLVLSLWRRFLNKIFTNIFPTQINVANQQEIIKKKLNNSPNKFYPIKHKEKLSTSSNKIDNENSTENYQKNISPFAKSHLYQDIQFLGIRNYFIHFFAMVFFGSGLSTATALFLQAITYKFYFFIPPENFSDINLLTTTLPAAILIGYGEAFLTGIIYAVLKIFKPEIIYPN